MVSSDDEANPMEKFREGTGGRRVLWWLAPGLLTWLLLFANVVLAYSADAIPHVARISRFSGWAFVVCWVASIIAAVIALPWRGIPWAVRLLVVILGAGPVIAVLWFLFVVFPHGLEGF